MITDNEIFSEEIPKEGVIDGHVTFTLKKTAPEDVMVSAMCANLVSSLLFEKLQAHGTNIVFSFANESAKIDVVARNENDGLNLLWEPKELTPEQLNEVHATIENKLEELAGPKEEPPKEKPPEEETPEDDDHLSKHLYKVP